MSSQQKNLILGGLVALGFSPEGDFLLTVSHSGRGVFATNSWERVARDYEVVYPVNGVAVGIGPLAGQVIPVACLDSDHEVTLDSPCGRYRLHCESDGIRIEHL